MKDRGREARKEWKWNRVGVRLQLASSGGRSRAEENIETGSGNRLWSSETRSGSEHTFFFHMAVASRKWQFLLH